MANINGFIEEKLMPIAGRIGANRVLISIRDGIALAMPLIIIGSLFTVISSFPVEAWTTMLDETGASTYLSKLTNGSFGIMALITSFGVARSYAKQRGVNGSAAGAISLSSFIVLTPSILSADEAEGIPMGYMGSKGLFLAIVVGVISALIFQWFINRDIRTGKTENNALYKQKNFRFNTKTGTFRFAFYAEIDESNFDKEFSSSNGKIVSLGADNSNFSIGISKSDKPDREKQETAEGGVCRIVLLSPAFLDPADVRLADFAIAETMPFRFLKSSLDSKSYNLSGGGLARSEKYELYAPGSVFFIKEEITSKDGDRSRVQEFKAALEGKNEFRQIGYNQYRAMRHFPATAVSTTDK